ncbi:MAG: glutamate-cysteine ligase family protein, partial [Actinomycetota bacterium]
MQIDFNPSTGPSLGVEVEFEIVDRVTRELSSAGGEILAIMGEGHPDGEHPKAKHELFECTIEVITGICSSVGEAKADLARSRSSVCACTSARVPA